MCLSSLYIEETTKMRLSSTPLELWATCAVRDGVLGCVVVAALLGQLRGDTFAPWDFILLCPSHLGSVFSHQGLAPAS